MREIGTLPDAFQARTLADYLLTLRIEARVEQGTDGYALWVCDEDRVARARQELDAFRQNPRDPRYAGASQTAEAIRQEEDAVEEDYNRRQTEMRDLLTEPSKAPRGKLFTAALIAVAILAAIVTRLGEDARERDPRMQALFIAPFETIERPGKGTLIEWQHLDRITKNHEVWRLITPVFIHFTFIHLLFNILVLHDLGGAFEERCGTWRFVLFFVAVAVASNLAQYYLGWTASVSEWRTGPQSNPQFGGLSGVNYGLFGYVWMKSRYQPDLGFVVTPTLVFMMVGWFLLCFTGAVGPIANVAHAAGLGLGVLVGAAPTVWRNLIVRK